MLETGELDFDTWAQDVYNKRQLCEDYILHIIEEDNIKIIELLYRYHDRFDKSYKEDYRQIRPSLNEQGELKIVVLETLIVRREQEDGSRGLSSTQTELLVENGQTIEAKTPVTKTQVLAINDSIASINSKDTELRRLLLVSDNYEEKVAITSKATVLPKAEEKDALAGDVVSVAVEASKHEKCGRCWVHSETVGTIEGFDGICADYVRKLTK